MTPAAFGLLLLLLSLLSSELFLPCGGFTVYRLSPYLFSAGNGISPLQRSSASASLMMSEYGVAGETVVVTGATSPLGKALALQAARLGHPVVGLAREGDALDALTEELEGIRSGCYTLAVDFRVPESIGRATTTMMMRTRHVEALIHCAGWAGPALPLSKVTASQFQETLNVNLISVDYLTRRLLPLLGDHKATQTPGSGPRSPASVDRSLLKSKLLSRVSVVSSGSAHRPVPMLGAYCVAKAGLLMWARCEAEELRQHGISVVAVQPGIIAIEGGGVAQVGLEPEEIDTSADVAGWRPEGLALTPDDAASKMLPLLLYHPPEFSGGEYHMDAQGVEELLAKCIANAEFAML